jgi:hypothetical protein
MTDNSTKSHAALIWSVADLLPGDHNQSASTARSSSLTVLRQFDCVLEPTKAALLERAEKLEGQVESTLTCPGAQREGDCTVRLKMALVLVVMVGLLATAGSTGARASSPKHSASGTTAHGTPVAPPAVKPCKSSLTKLLKEPNTHVSNYLFAPATGATTPQAAIRRVVGSENGRGLIAMCPYITSEMVLDVVDTAVLFTGGATPPEMVRVLLDGAGVPAETVTINKLRCTKSECSATVTSSLSNSGSTSTSTEDVQATKYRSGWFVSQYELGSASGSGSLSAQNPQS